MTNVESRFTFITDSSGGTVGCLFKPGIAEREIGIGEIIELDRNRLFELDRSGNAHAVEFFYPFEELEDLSKPPTSIADLRDWPRDLGLPPVEEVVLLLNEHGVVPQVDNDLVD